MLSEIEERIRTQIQNSDVPFLGLLGDAFTRADRQAIEVATLADSTVQGYIGYLARFPALFSVNLTAHIMEGAGQGGHLDLYRHLERAIGSDLEFTPTEKEKLWKAFRKAILSLGFEPSSRISGNHFMFNEYLRQVGVPLAFADDLAEKMLSFAKRLGLPDEDDQEAIRSWQQALDSKLETNFSVTARRAVALDRDGYYTRVFLRVYESLAQQAANPCKNALEKAMADAFNRQPLHGKFRRAVMPFVVLNDGMLGIFIPGGEEREFELSIDSEVLRHRSGLEDRFIALSNPLTREIAVREVSGGQTSLFRLWEDAKPNRMLIFSDSGRLSSTAQLNQAEPLVLPPGRYFVLSRFVPNGIQADPLCDDPAIVGFELEVHPGKEINLANGPAKLSIQGETQPFASWSGKNRTSKEGIEFFYGRLGLRVEFPPEWAAFSGRSFVVRLSAGALGEPFQHSFVVDDTGNAHIDISEVIERAGWHAGFARIVAEVSRPGETRSLLRTSAFFWLGLQQVRHGLEFVCDAEPMNLAHQLNENIETKGNVLKPRDGLSRTIRLVFRLDERRHQTLTWNIPGIFVEIENTSEAGGAVRFAKPIGGIEVVSLTSNKQILISSSEPATLKLGDWTQRIDFTRTPTKRISASFLCSRLTAASNNLTIQLDGSNLEIDLLRLVQPHNVRKMNCKLWQGQFTVKLEVPKELEAARVSVLDLISGQDAEISLKANTGEWEHHRFGRAQLMSLPADDGTFSAYLHFDMQVWPSGAWLFKFDGCVGGIWGHLENERQDIFAAGLIYDGTGKEVRVNQLLESLDGLSEKDSLDVLSRVQKAMLTCYALESWQSVHWLLDIWRKLVGHWKGKPQDAVATLVDCAVARPTEDASATWMLQQTVGATVPEIFALPAPAYRQVNQRSYPLVSVLRAIPEIKSQYPNVFPDLIHVAVASAFSNFAAIAKGAIPHGFDLDRYVSALQHTSDPIEDRFKLENDSFQPGPSDWLGTNPLQICHAVHGIRI